MRYCLILFTLRIEDSTLNNNNDRDIEFNKGRTK